MDSAPKPATVLSPVVWDEALIREKYPRSIKLRIKRGRKGRIRSGR